MNRVLRIGVTLPELLVSLGLFSIILVVFGVLYRIGNTNFRQGTTQVALSQSARLAAEHVLPYLTCAIPASSTSGGPLYSPDAEASQSDLAVNSIYQIDFSSCVDFLNSDPSAAPGFTDRRGGAAKHRYRIRFDVAKERLVLEKLDANTDPLTATVIGAPKLLAKNLRRVTFERVDGGINMRVRVRATDKNGQFYDDLRSVEGRSLDGDANGVPQNRKAREYDLFTAVPIPYLNVR